MRYTSKANFVLPEYADVIDIENINENFETIDRLIGSANGLATLDSVGKVLYTQLPEMDYIPNKDRGIAGGVATLDEEGRIVQPINLENTSIVLYTEQTLSEDQQAQVRANIDAADSLYVQNLDTTLSELRETSTVAISELQARDEEIYSEMIKILENGNIPSYWQNSLDAGVEEINSALLTAGYNKSAFLFYSDVHWNYGSKISPKLLKYLYEHTGINKTFFGGDIVNNEADDYDTMAYLWDWRNQIKEISNHHSVVGNHDDGNTTNNLFSEQYVYGYLLAAEESPDVIRGDSGLYYYIDSPSEKTRYLFIDTAYKTILYDTNQVEFFVNALTSTPANWHIVAIAHIWYNTNYDVNPPTVGSLSYGGSMLLDLFDDYNSRSNGSVSVSSNTVSYDFASCEGKVEFCIGGHTHWDYDGRSTDGIPVILVETDSYHVRSGLSCSEGSDTEASVNGVIADYNNGTISVVRVGRGTSRSLSIYESPDNPDTPDDPNNPEDDLSYTNVLSTAIDVDGLPYNNGAGYKDDTRYSISGSSEVSAPGWDITGYIEASGGDTIRLKNVEMNYDLPEGLADSTIFSGIILYTGDLSCYTNIAIASQPDVFEANWLPLFNDEGNVVQFTIPEYISSSVKYIRIVCQNLSSNSIITVNEEIPDSPDVSEPQYTNILTIATDADGSLYNGGKGYKDDIRINSSLVETTATGWDITGYFSCKTGDTIRFKNLQFLDIDGTGGDYKRSCIYMFDSSYGYISRSPDYTLDSLPADVWNPVYDSNGDVVQLTIPSAYGNDVSLIRIGAKEITEESIITVNEEITE